MNLVFMGTAEFGIPSLEALCANGYVPKAIVTVPDKPAGRGQKIGHSPVKEFALQHNISLLQPEKLKDPAFIEALSALQPDVVVVVAFRILPPEVFRIPSKGSFNLHASLLPKYRGAAPIQWALIQGEKETGVTTFLLEDKVDTGNIILQERLPVGAEETAGEIHDKLSMLGADLVLRTVRRMESGDILHSMQDHGSATPAPKIFKEDCRIDWTKSAKEIHDFIRGLSPRPCAFTSHNGITIRMYRSRVVSGDSSGPPGEIVRVDDLLCVFTGTGMVEILELQQEGKKILKTAEFLRGYHFKNGEMMGS